MDKQKHKCIDCGIEFEEYETSCDCSYCDGEGEIETTVEWEIDDCISVCPICSGKGVVYWIEKERCKKCELSRQLEKSYLYDDLEYNQE